MRTTAILLSAISVTTNCTADVDTAHPRPEPFVAPIKPTAPIKPLDPWNRALLTRALDMSGLRVGAATYPMALIDANTGARVEAIPEEVSRPTVIAVGPIGDATFGERLMDLDAIRFKYDERFDLIAVATQFHAGRPQPTPVQTASADGHSKAARWRRELALSAPMYLPLAEDDPAARVLTTYYNFAQGCTVMLIDTTNTVAYNVFEPRHFAPFNTSLIAALELPATTP